ncbi:hypothetical protein PRIC2_002484 [Phytophthora ramorum]
MADNCLPRLRVFLDASLLALLLLTTFALHRRVTANRTSSKPYANALYDHRNRSFRRSTAVSVLGLEAWGVLGLVLSLEHGCPASHWLTVLCLSLSGGCMVVGGWLGVREALLAIDGDVLTLLWCLRCSCCSRLTQRALLLPPLALLVTLNAASWLESRTTETCSTSELLSPPTFFAGAAAVFVAMFTATLVVVGCSMSPRRYRTVSTRVAKTLVALSITVVALTSIGWAVVGLMSIPRHRATVDLATLSDGSCWSDVTVCHAAQGSIAQLMVVGSLLLVITFCCRLENFFLAPNAPEIDMTELSPRLAAIKIPEAGVGKASEARTPEDVTVLV